MIDLPHLYRILDWSYKQRDKPPGESVVIAIVPPSAIGEQFPEDGRAGEDSSPPHCTVCYIGKVPLELENKILTIASNVCSNTRPFRLTLGKTSVFENPEADAHHVQVKGQKLHNFHDSLKQAFALNQIQVDAKYPSYQPHMTLEYVKPGQERRYADAKPKGEWRVENAWLWGLTQPYLLQFK